MEAIASPQQLALTSLVVIPARLNSTRLPQKLLLRHTGKSLLQHTHEAALRARKPVGVLVAADDELLASEVRRFGGQVQLTDPAAPSGTDRVAAVAAHRPEIDIIVNLQGDEPELSGWAIDQAIGLLEQNPQAMIATLATPIRRHEQLFDPSCVKVVCDDFGRALYFSRSPIPYPRDGAQRGLSEAPYRFLQHIGLYAYRREFLLQLARMPRSDLERIENLEQLRALSAGFTIQVAIVDEVASGIDTLDDYRAFVTRVTGG